MENVFELKETVGKSEGIFATKFIKAGETLIVGKVEKKLDKNHSQVLQVVEKNMCFLQD